MKKKFWHGILSTGILVWIMSCSLAGLAQKINGTPGSPTSTYTIQGKTIPIPPLPFEGVIKTSALDSKPYWPARLVPPAGAPNILLIMTDDQGYGVSGTFGGVIPTPGIGSCCKSRSAIYAVSFHRTLLSYPGCPDYRSQPSLSW